MVMIVNTNLAQKTHYEIIGVEQNASQEEIRKTYRSAILNYHPDKLHKAGVAPTPEPGLENKFLEVQKAWEVLSNPSSRALYDNELQTLKHDVVTAEDISSDAMTIEDDGDYFQLSYHCRCSDSVSVDSSELSEMGYVISRDESEISLQRPISLPAYVVLPCGSCSLKFRLLLGVHVTLQTQLSG